MRGNKRGGQTEGRNGRAHLHPLARPPPLPAADQINASPDEESGIGELLSTMGVRRPGLRIVSFEMPAKERSVQLAVSRHRSSRAHPLTLALHRRALYLSGGLLSVTSRILVVDMLTKNVPTEMITGLVVLHADK